MRLSDVFGEGAVRCRRPHVLRTAIEDLALLQVSLGAGEGKKKKDGKKAAAAAVAQPRPSEPAGGTEWDDNDDDDDDRWGFECFKCGHDGDLLCCEVRPMAWRLLAIVNHILGHEVM